MTIDELIQTEMATHHIPGLSLAVVRQGEVVQAGGYGFANLEWRAPATSDTAYQIASVTKQFTATAVMLLVQEGKLDLHQSIGRYLEDTPESWQAVTVEQLLNHTGGLMRDGTVGYWTKPDDIKQDYAYPQMFQMLAQAPLDFVPGTKMSYSNSGYFLAGLIIERITQQSLNDFLTERIFAPLLMTSTRINDLSAVIPQRATGYRWTEQGWQHPAYIGLNHHFANGGLISTVNDLARWDAALYTARILPQTALAQMWTPATLRDGTVTDYGLGWGIGTHEGHRVVAHSGALPGFTTYIGRFIDDGLTVILFTNAADASPATIAKSVAMHYLA